MVIDSCILARKKKVSSEEKKIYFILSIWLYVGGYG
jgi:hypothetical protein